jgi:DNA-binding NarL/FixJ family response regulator
LIREFRTRGGHGESGPARPSPHDLTSREWEVLDCLRDGYTTKTIAERLFITETTVGRHISSILKKLEVSSREAAVELVGDRSENLNGK